VAVQAAASSLLLDASPLTIGWNPKALPHHGILPEFAGNPVVAFATIFEDFSGNTRPRDTICPRLLARKDRVR